MSIIDKIKAFFNRKDEEKQADEFNSLFGDNEVKELSEASKIYEETIEPLDLPEGEIVSFQDEVLDTNSAISIEKFKHNLEILTKQAKEKGKIDRFILIREDNYFPDDWEWRVLSQNTNIEPEVNFLSYELRKSYALEKKGIPLYTEMMGIKIHNEVSKEQLKEALTDVDKNLGAVMLPSRFRSTKHFTVNTPLGVTGNYNNVTMNRNYIVLDDMHNFLNSGYGYSVAYHDAYLDVSHEALPISPDAIVLIDDEKYDSVMSDEKVASQLAQRRVVRFKGDSVVAINMILTEMGALPSQVGLQYMKYDEEVREILDKSIKNVATEYGLFFDKSHAGELKQNGGHFSNYYDEKNMDYEKAKAEFFEFLAKKFPAQENLFENYSGIDSELASEIIDALGTESLVNAIDEYNKMAKERLTKTKELYKEERAHITPEIHKQFVDTITLINELYKGDVKYESFDEREKTEEIIRKFIQSEKVSEQLQASQKVREILINRGIEQSENLTMKELVSNAIINKTTKDMVVECEKIELDKINNYQERGEIIGD